jgi:hypothetical protein
MNIYLKIMYSITMAVQQQPKHISQTSRLDSLSFLPSNRGYTVEGKKFYGGTGAIDGAGNVKLVDGNQDLCVWGRKGFTKWSLEGETDYEGLGVFRHGRKLLECNSKAPCKNELFYGGECNHRWDPSHCENFYHFSRRDSDGYVLKRGGKAVCRYHAKGDHKCWERINGFHARTFVHI